MIHTMPLKYRLILRLAEHAGFVFVNAASKSDAEIAERLEALREGNTRVAGWFVLADAILDVFAEPDAQMIRGGAAIIEANAGDRPPGIVLARGVFREMVAQARRPMR